MLELDFFSDAISYIDQHAGVDKDKEPPQRPKDNIKKVFLESVAKEKDKNPSPSSSLKRDYYAEFKAKQDLKKQPPTIPLKTENYNVDVENGIIILKGTRYEIPSFFNKKMIEKGDKKTLEMIFIFLGYPELELIK